MRRRTALLLATALPGLAWAASTPELLKRVQKRLLEAPVLRGEFEQRKSVKGFRNPLVSRGDFLVARERGVVWRTREPFVSSLVLTRDRLLARQADGSVGTQIDTRDEPGLRAVNQMLFALMAADLGTLAQRFRIEGELQGADGWQLVLVPLDAALAQWVTRIELEGERHVRSVKLQETRGDTTHIRFTQQQTADALTREEAGRFE
jgi:hypothetical protein